MLYRALGLESKIPRYMHLPLVVGPDGKRLAKRHGDTRLSFYRQQGISAGRVLGLLARWCGTQIDGEISLKELLEQFDMARMPRDRIIMSATDETIF
jgi:glutamyl-tRNA synthetase